MDDKIETAMETEKKEQEEARRKKYEIHMMILKVTYLVPFLAPFYRR